MVTTIINTAGTTVAEVSDATINGPSGSSAATPLDFIGDGIGNYGAYVQNNMMRLLENFAKTTAPTVPVEGQLWYDKTTTKKTMNMWNGSSWVVIAGSTNATGLMFTPAATATNINFRNTGGTRIFQAPGTSANYYPTGVLLIPNGSITSAGPATFNLYTSSSEDILSNSVIVSPATNKFVWFNIEGSTRFVSGTNSIFLEVSSAAASGAMNMDAYVFGFIRG